MAQADPGAPAEAGSALRLDDVSARHGRVPVLRGIGLTIRAGEAVGILGANGAGKTTLLNTVSGFLKPAAGTVTLGHERIDGLPPHAVVRRGLLHVSQERDLFGHLTVMDNLTIGSLSRGRSRFAHNLERVMHHFPRLKERRTQRSDTMSGGEQQMLAIGRALMAEPSVLMLDEPSAGLSPLFVGEIGAMMRSVRAESNLTLLLVEQNMSLASKVVDRFYALKAGQVVAEGTAEDLGHQPEELARLYYL